VAREVRQHLAGLLGGVGAALGLAEDLLGVDGLLRGADLADRVCVDQVVVLGGLQDAVQHRAAGHHRVVGETGAQAGLPAAHQARGDRAQLAGTKERQDVAPQAALGGRQGGRASVGVG
jgi:hypothetical protein